MRGVYERCCGLNIHKKSVVACALITPETGEVQRHLRTFSTMTAGLLALTDWLDSLQITVVAMEPTGIFWRPVFNLLEEGRTIILVNAQHMKAVPGRKQTSRIVVRTVQPKLMKNERTTGKVKNLDN